MPPDGSAKDWRELLRDLAADGHLQLPRALVRLRRRLGFTAEEWWVAEAVINEMTSPRGTPPTYKELMEITGYSQVSLRRLLASLYGKGLARPTGIQYDRTPVVDFSPLFQALYHALIFERSRSVLSGSEDPKPLNSERLPLKNERVPLSSERLPLKNERIGCETRLLPVGESGVPETGDLILETVLQCGTERPAGGDDNGNGNDGGHYGSLRGLQERRQRELESKIGG